MHFFALIAETDPAFWERMLEKWGFPAVALLLIGLWGRKQIERLIDSHVKLIDVLSGTVGDTHKLVRKIHRYVRPKDAIDEEDGL